MPKIPMIQLAPEVEEIARILIAKYHPHLADADLLYLFTDQRRKRCDRVRLGSASKMTSLQRFLASNSQSVESGHDFYLMFDSNEWGQLTDHQMRALTEHELLHCCVYVKSGFSWRRLGIDENKEDHIEWRYGLRGHTIEEFHEVIDRYGFWRGDEHEQKFAEAVKQLSLPGLVIQAQSRN